MSPSSTVELHVRSAGEGRPVVLLHGIGGDHTVWNAVLPLLSNDHKVIVPDLRGHGRSPYPEGSTMQIPELSADVLAMLDRESPGTPVDLVGISAGGFLTLAIALGHPDRVRSVALVGSADHCDAHTRSIGARWAEVYRDEGADALALRLLKDLYYPDWIEEHLEVADQVRAMLTERDLSGMLRWAETIRSFDLRGRLGSFRRPMLVIQGMDDRVVDPSHARLLRQTIRGTEVRLLAQTGHMVPVERPKETAEAIRSFVARSPGPPPTAG